MTTTIAIPTLHTHRLTLRSFHAGDLDASAAMEADPAVRQYRGGDIMDRDQVWTSMQLRLGQWALRGYGVFAIEATEDNRFLGFTGILHPPEWPEPELAWSLARPHWGNGYASEAAGCARDWAFGQAGVASLASFIHPGNAPSKRVARRLGAVREGNIALRGQSVERWVHPAPGRGVVV
jgi:RimJ/RimL family protein N-acetyltransferase